MEELKFIHSKINIYVEWNKKEISATHLLLHSEWLNPQQIWVFAFCEIRNDIK